MTFLEKENQEKRERKNFLWPGAFAAAAGTWAENVVLLLLGVLWAVCWLIWLAKGKGCSSSLSRSSPHQIGTCSFPPHQCWFTSSCPYVIPQKEKHRIEWFWQSLCPTVCGLCYDPWLEWVRRKAKQQHLFIVSELSFPTFLFMSHHTVWQPTWIRN